MNPMGKQSRVLKGVVLLLLALLALLLLRACDRGREGGEVPPPPKTGRISTLGRFDETMAEHAARMDGHFRVRCTPELHALLERPSSVRPGNDLMGEIRCMNGIHACRLFWDGDELELSGISYYAGWRILCAVRNGTENELDARERATLRAARNLVAGASGSPVEKERYIHDALCRRIVYYTNDESGEDKDCAVGALLDGLADCDGYADAMMLCCGLAGIPCRYMHGDARDAGEGTVERPSGSSGHMWNLVEIAGRWVSVDVTWGDQTNGISYLSYNLGREDATLAYRWDPRVLFVELAEESDSASRLMPDQRRTVVRSLEEVYRAARRAAESHVRRFTFLCPDRLLWQTAETEFHRMLSRGGWKSYRHVQGGRMLEVTDIQTDGHLRFCDTEEDALDAIRGFAVAGTGSFALYFRPALADALLADECAGLERLLSRSPLAEPGVFRYSPESGSVRLENALFAPTPPLCRSERDILVLLRRELAEKPAEMAFLVPDRFDFSAVQERVFDCVHSMGVKHFTWSCAGNRVRLMNLEYHGEFRLVESRADVAGYLRSARKSGKRVVRMHCPTELYATLKADNARAFWKMLEEAGFGECTVYSNDRTCILTVEW